MSNKSNPQILALDRVYEAVLNHFPFKDKTGLEQFKKSYKEYLLKLSKHLISDEEYFLLIEEFLAKLKNAHTFLNSYPNRKYYKPRKYIVVKNNKDFYLLKDNKSLGKINSINSLKPQKKYNSIKKNISASTKQYERYRSLMFMLAGRKPGYVDVVITDNRRIRKFHLKQEKILQKPMNKSDLFNFNFIDDIAYLKIGSWLNIYKKDLMFFIDNAISQIIKKKTQGIILDLRNNFGGNANIAAYFASKLFKKKAIFGITKTRISQSRFKYKMNKLYIQPTKPYINLPLIVIANAVCMSSTEYLIAGLKDNNRAYIIGQKTAGSSGNPIGIDIDFKTKSFNISVATWLYYRKNQKLLEGNGINPHLVVENTLDDMLVNKDKFIEKAISKIKNPS